MRNSNVASLTASQKKADWRCIWPECQDRLPVRTGLRKSKPPSSVCLDYLAAQESAPGEAAQVREESLRSATRVSKLVLSGMVRKKWLVREDISAVRDATRTIKIAVLKSAEGKLNDNQRQLVETLAASGGRVPAEALQALEIPRTTLGTLVRRGLVEIVEEPADFAISQSKPRPSFRIRFQFSTAGRTEPPARSGCSS